MSLQRKTLIIIVATLICLMAGIYLAATLLILSGIHVPENVRVGRIQAERILLGSLLLSGLVFGAVMMYLLRSQVIQRIVGLGRAVKSITKSGDPTRRVRVSGEDEIADLASSVNDMLAAIEASRAALHTSEENARAIMNAMTESAFLVDYRGQILDINETAAVRMGREIDDIIGREFKDVFPPELAEARLERVRDVFKSGRRVRFEDSRKGVIFDTSIYPVFDAEGKVERVAVFGRDITERRKAEEALKKSEQRYRRLIESVNSIVMRWNAEGHITFLNRFGQRYFGYESEEILGKSIIGTIVPETEASGRDLKAMIGRIVSHPEEHVLNENENMCRDGRRVWVVWSNKPVMDKEGRLVEVLSIGNDATERKRIEKALRHRIDIERIVTLLSARLLDVPLHEMDDAIGDALETIGRFFGADGSSLVLFHVRTQTIEQMYEWSSRTGTDHRVYDRQGLPLDEVPWLKARMMNSETVHIPDVAALPPEASGEASYLRRRNTASFVAVPLRWRSRLLGYMGFDAETPRDWSEQDIKYLVVVGEILVSAIQHHRYEEQLFLQKSRLETLVELDHMADVAPADMALFVLKGAVRVTQSTCGMVALIRKGEARFEPFCWTPDDMAQADAQAYFALEEEGPWNDVVFRRVPVMVNDYAASPSSGKHPLEGRAPIKRFLAVPILDGDKVEAVAAVANKEDDYEQMDTDQLSLLMSSAWNKMRRKAADAWIQSEIDEIASIQRGLLPAVMPRIDGMRLAATFDTYDRAGGDYYDIVPFGKPAPDADLEAHRRWLVVIADASGHGPSAAVVVAMMSSLIRSYPAELDGPAALMAYMNRHLCERSVHRSFVTAVLALVDLASHTMTYTCAGHPPALILDSDGSMVELESTGDMPLGIFGESTFHENTIAVSAGRRMLLYTDGITESLSPVGEPFGLSRLQQCFAEAAGAAEEITEDILRRLRAHEEGERPKDDQTMLLVEFVGETS